MEPLNKLQKWLGLAEKAEGKYGVVERIPQVWKAIKWSWGIVMGAVVAIVNRIPFITLPGFAPWVWEVLALSVFFVSVGVVVSIPTLQNRKLRALLSRAKTTDADEDGHMSVAPLIETPDTKSLTLGDALQEQIDALPSEREMLDSALAEVDQRKKETQALREEQSEQAIITQMAFKQHRAEVERLQTELRRWQEFVWYGQHLASFRPLGESDYSVMVSRVGELREHVKVLLTTSYALWAKAAGWTELRADYESPSYWPARLINEFVFRPFENAVQDFEQLLENEPQKDPRPYILLVYKKHGKIGLWVTHLLKASKKHPGVQLRLADWEDAKKAFERALREKCGAPQLRDLRLAIEVHDRKMRQMMPDELLFTQLAPRSEAPPDPAPEGERPGT